MSVVVAKQKKISGKMFLIGDSQLTGVKPRSGEFISCHRGARIQDIVDIIDDITKEIDISKFNVVGVWVGGNDAFPRRGGAYNKQVIKNSLSMLVTKIKGKTDAKIILVSATPRTGKAGENMKNVNKIIQEVAREAEVRVANVYKKLQKQKIRYLDRDGIHLTVLGKEIVLDTIRYMATQENVMKEAVRWEKRAQRNYNRFVIYVRGGQCRLSNFWVEDLVLGGVSCSSGEQAYQFWKARETCNEDLAIRIWQAKTPKQAKYIGSIVNKRMGKINNRLKVNICKAVVAARIRQNPRFAMELRATGRRRIEHNVSNSFWGIINGLGRNMFGIILMEARSQFFY